MAVSRSFMVMPMTVGGVVVERSLITSVRLVW